MTSTSGTLVALAVVLAAAGGLAVAQDGTPPTSATEGTPPGARFQIQEAGPNVLRLDRETGEIASCGVVKEGGAWSCETVVAAEGAGTATEDVDATGGIAETPPGDAPSLAAENARLRARVAALEERLSRIARLAGSFETETSEADPADDMSDTLIDVAATQREIDSALAVTDYAVRRFRDLYNALGSGDTTP